MPWSMLWSMLDLAVSADGCGQASSAFGLISLTSRASERTRFGRRLESFDDSTCPIVPKNRAACHSFPPAHLGAKLNSSPHFPPSQPGQQTLGIEIVYAIRDSRVTCQKSSIDSG